MSGAFCGIQSQLNFLDQPSLWGGLAASGRPVDAPVGAVRVSGLVRPKDDAATQRNEGDTSPQNGSCAVTCGYCAGT